MDTYSGSSGNVNDGSQNPNQNQGRANWGNMLVGGSLLGQPLPNGLHVSGHNDGQNLGNGDTQGNMNLNVNINGQGMNDYSSNNNLIGMEDFGNWDSSFLMPVSLQDQLRIHFDDQ